MTDTETTPGPCTVYLPNRIDPDTIVESDDEELLVHVVESDNMEADAHLIAAAFNAAHELPDEYDPVEAVEALGNLIEAAEQMLSDVHSNDPSEPNPQRPSNGVVNRLKGALQQARRE